MPATVSAPPYCLIHQPPGLAGIGTRLLDNTVCLPVVGKGHTYSHISAHRGPRERTRCPNHPHPEVQLSVFLSETVPATGPRHHDSCGLQTCRTTSLEGDWKGALEVVEATFSPSAAATEANVSLWPSGSQFTRDSGSSETRARARLHTPRNQRGRQCYSLRAEVPSRGSLTHFWQSSSRFCLALWLLPAGLLRFPK